MSELDTQHRSRMRKSKNKNDHNNGGNAENEDDSEFQTKFDTHEPVSLFKPKKRLKNLKHSRIKIKKHQKSPKRLKIKHLHRRRQTSMAVQLQTLHFQLERARGIFTDVSRCCSKRREINEVREVKYDGPIEHFISP
jgi:hypothetical protein